MPSRPPVLPRSTSVLRSARRGALIALLLGAPAARLDAQAACAAGTVADYTASGFSCRIGSWVLSAFDFGTDRTAVGGAAATVAAAQGVSLTPFLVLDAVGRTTFGFDFAGFAASVDGNGSTEGSVFGDAFVGLGLTLTSLDPGVGLGGARVLGTQRVAGVPRPGDVTGTVESLLGAVVAAIEPSPTSEFCLFVWERVQTPADGVLDREGTCTEAPAPRWVGVSVSAAAQVAGHEPGAPLAAGVHTSATRVQFVEAPVAAVPEPATVALLGGGLLALAGVAARRRAASPAR
jgi:hypothetical protein